MSFGVGVICDFFFFFHKSKGWWQVSDIPLEYSVERDVPGLDQVKLDTCTWYDDWISMHGHALTADVVTLNRRVTIRDRHLQSASGCLANGLDVIVWRLLHP